MGLLEQALGPSGTFCANHTLKLRLQVAEKLKIELPESLRCLEPMLRPKVWLTYEDFKLPEREAPKMELTKGPMIEWLIFRNFSLQTEGQMGALLDLFDDMKANAQSVALKSIDASQLELASKALTLDGKRRLKLVDTKFARLGNNSIMLINAEGLLLDGLELGQPLGGSPILLHFNKRDQEKDPFELIVRNSLRSQHLGDSPLFSLVLFTRALSRVNFTADLRDNYLAGKIPQQNFMAPLVELAKNGLFAPKLVRLDPIGCCYESNKWLLTSNLSQNGSVQFEAECGDLAGLSVAEMMSKSESDFKSSCSSERNALAITLITLAGILLLLSALGLVLARHLLPKWTKSGQSIFVNSSRVASVAPNNQASPNASQVTLASSGGQPRPRGRNSPGPKSSHSNTFKYSSKPSYNSNLGQQRASSAAKLRGAAQPNQRPSGMLLIKGRSATRSPRGNSATMAPGGRHSPGSSNQRPHKAASGTSAGVGSAGGSSAGRDTTISAAGSSTSEEQ